MNAQFLVVALLLAAAAFAAGRLWPGPGGVAVVVGLAVLAALAADAALGRRLRRVAERIGASLHDGEPEPVQLSGSEAGRELAVALNALAAAHRRRGEQLALEHPWRTELVDSLVQPALLFSDEERLLAANDAARRLLGIPVDASDSTVMQAVGNAALAGAVKEARHLGTPVTVDTEHGEHDLRSVVSLVGDQTLMIIADRTQERRVEELRRNFVVNASHELKTPVTSIQTLAEALSITLRSDPSRAGALVKRLEGEAERLARLVYDLLDLRRLEDRGPLDRAQIDLAELTRRVVAGLVPRAEASDVEVSVDAPDRAMVAGVAGDLETVVMNLVTNGIQYNRPGGSVEVTITERVGHRVLVVRDTGIGIPQQDLSRVFERFYRVDLARSRETGGTGLGLSIVRHAVENHGGTIRVDSRLGEGTTFTVTLPVTAPTAPAP